MIMFWCHLPLQFNYFSFFLLCLEMDYVFGSIKIRWLLSIYSLTPKYQFDLCSFLPCGYLWATKIWPFLLKGTLTCFALLIFSGFSCGYSILSLAIFILLWIYFFLVACCLNYIVSYRQLNGSNMLIKSSHLIHFPEKNKNRVIHPILVDNPWEVDISQVKIAFPPFGMINIFSKCLRRSSLVSKLNYPLQSWSSMWCPLYLPLLTFVEGNKDASPCVYIYESRVHKWEVICFMCQKQLL